MVLVVEGHVEQLVAVPPGCGQLREEVCCAVDAVAALHLAGVAERRHVP